MYPHVCMRVRARSREKHWLRTLLNDASFVVQHALHLAAPHVHQAGLPHKGLAPVEAGAVGQVGTHRDQKANVVLAQPWRWRGDVDGDRGWAERGDGRGGGQQWGVR